ncbi:MAG TPA: hypothetical protein DHV62_09135 [Elusimicrobia bacterium]|jgi:hypothetical protein|nr:hypothetical protein [Elusimicrobiota bacterium]
MLRIFSRIFRGFGHIHSSVSKFWLATVFTVYWLDWLSRKNLELVSIVEGLKKEFFYLGLFCAVIFILAGMRSILTIRIGMKKEGENWIPPAMSPLKEKMEVLVVTFIFIFLFFGGRICWQLRTIPGTQTVKFFLLLIATWAIIVVFLPGLLLEYALFTYLPNIYRGDIKRYRRIYMGIIRIMHIVLLLILGAGTYWQYRIAFR